MFNLDQPNVELWSQRRAWLREAQHKEEKHWSTARFSSNTLLLLVDIELAFCTGAWLSVVVMSYAAIDATLRDVYASNYTKKSQQLYGHNSDLDWLRQLRNELMHVSPPGTRSQVWKLPATDFLACLNALEPEAQRAVTLVYRAVYEYART